MSHEIDVSRQELGCGRLDASHEDDAVRALRQDGFLILNDIIELSHVETLRERMFQDLDTILARPDAPFNFNSGNLQQDPPPFPPYLFHDVLLNPLVTQVTRAILGRGLKNYYYSGNTNLPGSTQQPVHVDVGQLWPHLDVAPPAHNFVVNIPVVDMDVRNGSTEIWPGTHLDTTLCVQNVAKEADIRVPEPAVEARRAVVSPLQPTVRAGSVIIRDIRLWHRGMPNRTTIPRPMIALIHAVSWWPCGEIEFPTGTEAFFEGSDLRTCTRFVEGSVDYLNHNQAYDYTP